MANTNSQIETMQRLMNYGRNTNKTQINNKPLLEHTVKADDGNTYGILRESSKYYIMVAPPKNSGVVAEDFSHIGGVNNRKQYEYNSYSTAMENLDLKVKNVNESVRVSQHNIKPVQKTVLKEEKDWQTKITQETRGQIDRFKQILNNVTLIENKYVPSAHTLPEAPDKNPSEKEVNTPFTDTAVAKGDKEFTKTETNYETAGGPYDKNGEATSADMQSDKKPSGNNNGQDTYSQKAKYVPEDSVANQHPTGGKVTRADENKQFNRVAKITEAQAAHVKKVLGWNKDKDYMDTSKGTEIGSSEPFTNAVGKESNQTEAPTEPIHENEGIAIHNTDNQNKPTPGTSEVGDTAPFEEKVNESGIEVTDVVGMPDNLGDEGGFNGETFDTEYENWVNSDTNEPFLDDEMNFGTNVAGEEPLPETMPTDAPQSNSIPTDGPFGESRQNKSRGRKVNEAAEQGWRGVPEARFVSHGEWSDPEIIYKGQSINYWDFADFFETEEAERNATPDEVQGILDDILFGMSETGGLENESCHDKKANMNEGSVDLGFGKHPAYRKVPMTTPPNKEVAPNGAKDWNDDSAKGEQPFGQKIGDGDPYDKLVDTITDSLMEHLNFH